MNCEFIVNYGDTPIRMQYYTIARRMRVSSLCSHILEVLRMKRAFTVGKMQLSTTD